MKIAITGGTGFVGRHVAHALVNAGHHVVLIARGFDHTDPSLNTLPNCHINAMGLDDPAMLAAVFAGCDAIAHCAGINREIGSQTYQNVHIDGTRNVVEAARNAGVRKIALLSFLRARPDCGSGYHESKWAAEEIIRNSGIDFTIFKCGVIYGNGDHMLNHLSHAFHTLPLFAFVGFTDKPIRPMAVDDVAILVKASLADGALSRKTVAVTGPEELTLRGAVKRVARVCGRKPVMFAMPVWFHYGLAWFVERLMVTPLVSLAQVRILSEGLAEPAGPCDSLPAELAPKTRFSEEQIRRGLPKAEKFGMRDIRCCKKHLRTRNIHGTRAFFEMP